MILPESTQCVASAPITTRLAVVTTSIRIWKKIHHRPEDFLASFEMVDGWVANHSEGRFENSLKPICILIWECFCNPGPCVVSSKIWSLHETFWPVHPSGCNSGPRFPFSHWQFRLRIVTIQSYTYFLSDNNKLHQLILFLFEHCQSSDQSLPWLQSTKKRLGGQRIALD